MGLSIPTSVSDVMRKDLGVQQPVHIPARAIARSLLIATLLLAACGGPARSEIVVSGAWVRAATATSPEMETDTGSATATMPSDDEHAGDMAGMAGGQMGSGAVSAAYMEIVNRGSAADWLVSVTTDVAGVAEIHTSELDDQGLIRMRPLTDGLEIPANGRVSLQPGGYHLMLMALRQDLVAGERIELTLNFESGQSLTVSAEVRAP